MRNLKKSLKRQRDVLDVCDGFLSDVFCDDVQLRIQKNLMKNLKNCLIQGHV